MVAPAAIPAVDRLHLGAGVRSSPPHRDLSAGPELPCWFEHRHLVGQQQGLADRRSGDHARWPRERSALSRPGRRDRALHHRSQRHEARLSRRIRYCGVGGSGHPARRAAGRHAGLRSIRGDEPRRHREELRAVLRVAATRSRSDFHDALHIGHDRKCKGRDARPSDSRPCRAGSRGIVPARRRRQEHVLVPADVARSRAHRGRNGRALRERDDLVL